MTTNSSLRLSRKHKAAIAIAILVLLYTIVGFLVAPPIVKSILTSTIEKELGRQATVRQIKLNPFALSVTVRDFELKEPDGEPFVGFEEFYANLQLSSIFHLAFTFSEIRVVAPYGKVKILPDGKFNFSDLLALFEQPKDKPEPTPGQGAYLPAVLVSNITVEKGRLAFQDLSLPTSFEVEVTPVELTLTDFTTRRESETRYTFAASMGEGEDIRSEGNISIDPIRAKGRFDASGIKIRTAWKYIQDLVKFEVASGSVNAAGQYVVDISGEEMDIKLNKGEVKLNAFELKEKGGKETLISVPLLSVRGANVDLSGKRVKVDSISTKTGRMAAWLDRDGTVNYQKLVPMELIQDKGGESSETADDSGAANQSWLVTVDDIKVENYEVDFENRMLEKPLRLNSKPVNLHLKNVSTKTGSKADVNVDLTFEQTGFVEIEGRVGIDPEFADLELHVSQFPMRPFGAFLESITLADFKKGSTNVDAKLTYGNYAGEGPLARFQGRISLDGFEVDDRLNKQDLIKFDSLVVDGLEFDLEPNNLKVSEIVVKEPYARVNIWANGTANVVEVLSPLAEPGAEEKFVLLKKVADFIKLKIREPVPVTMDNVRVVNGSANFSDFFIKPNFAANIQNLNGAVKGISSKAQARADVLLEGNVDKHAPVKIVGQINPLSAEPFADIAVSFKNFELTKVTPYSGKFAGYTIEKGRASLELKYRWEGSRINGENQILLEQFTLGERVESASATTLPVKLALALMKDSKGNIWLDVPVEGDLDDPKFSYGSVVYQALSQAMGNIVKSPFVALGSLAGGGSKDLASIEFGFGSTVLEEEVKKLDVLAEALQERPGLILEIKGAANKEHDAKALLERGYAVVDETVLREFAQERAIHIKDHLVVQGGIPGDRIFLLGVKVVEIAEEETVSVKLSVSGG